MTEDQLKALGIEAKWLEPLNETFEKYEINELNESGLTMWRGSSTHLTDLTYYREILEGFEHITFMGYNPITNEPKLKVEGNYVNSTDPLLYYS